jgi:hypothetical protein
LARPPLVPEEKSRGGTKGKGTRTSYPKRMLLLRVHEKLAINLSGHLNEKRAAKQKKKEDKERNKSAEAAAALRLIPLGSELIRTKIWTAGRKDGKLPTKKDLLAYLALLPSGTATPATIITDIRAVFGVCV